MAEHHGAEHHILGQFLGFGFDHQHAFAGARDHQIEVAVRHVVDAGVQHVLTVDHADAATGDRAHEGHAGKGQRGGRADQRGNVGVVLHVER